MLRAAERSGRLLAPFAHRHCDSRRGGGGAVVGGAIGKANSGTRMEDVQCCHDVPASGSPQYLDTAYTFQGVEHHVQTTVPAGATITVNRFGEPRV